MYNTCIGIAYVHQSSCPFVLLFKQRSGCTFCELPWIGTIAIHDQRM